MRKLKSKRLKKQRKIILASIISLTFILSIGYAAFSTNISLSAKGNINERSRVIQSWTINSNSDFHNSEYRENIVSVTFLNTAKVSSNAYKSWDVSAAKDKGVIAYITINEEDTTKYDLFIGAKGGVVANEDSGYLFSEFMNIKSINFQNNFDTSSTINMSYMFYKCVELINLDVTSFNTSQVQNMSHMFGGDWGQLKYPMKLKKITGLEFFNTSKVRNFEYMFTICENLETIDVSQWNTNSATNMIGMFFDTSVTTLNVSNFNTSNVTTMHSMFGYNRHLKEIKGLESFNTQKVTSMYIMFANDVEIEKLNLSSFDTSMLASTESMFRSCYKLNTIYVSNKFVTTAVRNSPDMFTSSTKLVGGNGTVYDASHIDKEYARIDTESTPGYFTLKTE